MNKLSNRRIKAKTRLQYEAAECGAASLATILGYYGKFVELSELRYACGVNRDGSNAKQLMQAARSYGLEAKAYRTNGDQLKEKGLFPCIIFWGFNHFLVVEGFSDTHAYLSDPAQGRIRVLMEEFLDSFTGIVLQMEPGKQFIKSGHDRSPLLTLPLALLPYRNSIGQLLITGTGQGILTLIVAGFTSTFIDSFLQNERLYFGIPIIWLLLTAIIGWLTLLSIQFIILRRLELLFSKRLTADLFRKLFKVTFGFYQARFPGEIASRMLLGLETTQVLISQLIRFGISLWISIIVLIVAFIISGWLSLLVVVIMSANLFLNWWLTEQRYDANRKLAIEQGKAQGKGLQGINNIETLKASGLEFDFLSQWQSSFGNVIVQNQLLGSQMAIATITASGSSFLLNALIITFGGLLIIAGKITLGTLVAFQFLQGQLIAPISTLPQLNSNIQRLIGSLGRLEDLKKSEDDPLVATFNVFLEPEDSDNEMPFKKQERLEGEIELKNLSYSFDPVSPPFIEDLNLKIPKGSQLAIVGRSGSGKTTLIRILAGLYQYTRGSILYDGKEWIDNGDILMRQSLAYVPQQVFIFNASVRENMTLWKPGYGQKELEQAAKDAQIYESIISHPEAFERVLKDNGSDLSGGERQRLEISRALLRNPSILLFDEATSALDNRTQSSVLDVLKQRGMTVISVAHRLDAALRSDQILVMENGKIVERGSPQDLIKTQGIFYDLVQSEQNQQVAP